MLTTKKEDLGKHEDKIIILKSLIDPSFQITFVKNLNKHPIMKIEGWVFIRRLDNYLFIYFLGRGTRLFEACYGIDYYRSIDFDIYFFDIYVRQILFKWLEQYRTGHADSQILDAFPDRHCQGYNWKSDGKFLNF